MPLATLRPRARRSSVALEEERTWVSFYRRVGHDPAIAREVLEALDADSSMKQAHLALYLSCRESVRRRQARREHDERVAQAVRRASRTLFLDVPQALARRLRRGLDLALACLGPPADTELSQLSHHPGYAPSRDAPDRASRALHSAR